jgi:hypothetical protein
VSSAHPPANHFLQPNPQNNSGVGFSLDCDIVKADGGDVKVEAKDGVYYSVSCLPKQSSQRRSLESIL